MNLATINNQQLTMSHFEIAKLAEKRSDSVKRTIESLASQGVIQLPQIVDVHNKEGARMVLRQACMVDQRDSYVVMAQVNPAFTGRLVDRWLELESKQRPSWMDKLSLEAQIALEDLSKQVEEKEVEIERLQGVCNTVTAQFAPGLTISTLCKSFNGVNIMQVNNTLIKMGVLLKSKHGYEPSSYARDNYFTVSYTDFEKDNGDHGQRSSVTLTLKGAKWLYRAYISGKLPMKKNWDGAYTHVEFEVKQ